MDIVYMPKRQHTRTLLETAPSIKLFPVAPNDVAFILLHELTCGILALDMRPCTRKMQEELAWLPFAIFVFKTRYIVWKGVQLRLGRHNMSARVWILLEQLDHGVLLAVIFVLIAVLSFIT